jgi:hypothetical protein
MLHRMSSWRGGTIAQALLLLALPLACGGIETPDLGEPPRDNPGLSGSSPGRGGSAGATADSGRGGRDGVLPPDGGVVGSSGTAGSGSDERPEAGAGGGNEPPRVHCDAVADVFRFKCGPSCHQNEGFTSGDFAVGPEEARAYIDRVSIHGANCGLVINSRDPQNSLILTKITGDFPGLNCGSQMPVGSFEINDDEIDCISDWLEQFAR